MLRSIKATQFAVLACLVALTFTSLPRTVHASSERRQLIQGDVVLNEDVTTISAEDRWPYTLALCVCNNGVPISVNCGATLIHPYVALTAGTCYRPFFMFNKSIKKQKIYIISYVLQTLQLTVSKNQKTLRFLLPVRCALFTEHQI